MLTVKPVLSCHSKIDKTKVLKTNGSLMKVKNIAKCSLSAKLLTILKTNFGLLFERPVLL